MKHEHKENKRSQKLWTILFIIPIRDKLKNKRAYHEAFESLREAPNIKFLYCTTLTL